MTDYIIASNGLDIHTADSKFHCVCTASSKNDAELILSALTRAASPSVLRAKCVESDQNNDQAIDSNSENAARKSPSEWQPIESAPKDGVTRIIAANPYYHFGGQTIVYWHKDFGKNGSWVTINENPDIIPEDVFTHWQPLPPPPNNHNREGA